MCLNVWGGEWGVPARHPIQNKQHGLGNEPHVLANGPHVHSIHEWGYSYYGELRLGHLFIMTRLG